MENCYKLKINYTFDSMLDIFLMLRNNKNNFKIGAHIDLNKAWNGQFNFGQEWNLQLVFVGVKDMWYVPKVHSLNL